MANTVDVRVASPALDRRPGPSGSLATTVFETVRHGDLHDEAEDFPAREGGLRYTGSCVSRGRKDS
jgi:hypothetical protein